MCKLDQARKQADVIFELRKAFSDSIMAYQQSGCTEEARLEMVKAREARDAAMEPFYVLCHELELGGTELLEAIAAHRNADRQRADTLVESMKKRLATMPVSWDEFSPLT